ncbi:hypothetical protein TrLO_g5545 [Triparma laevis f. longispina]|uniref:Ion transport domain-containing protein n=1 Tax=Triparma laevis f. longispina TaxID=1714387 RepID=A0A9W7F5W6_9STRA|nr:hypothetical protein TrLO_g5545 [Triparma laevis f. longispina]
MVGGTAWFLYLMILGTFESSAFPGAWSQGIFLCYSFLVVIILLNVLIAIVSDSYDAILVTSTELFWRSRLELVVEVSTTFSWVDTSAGIQLDLKLKASSTDWTGRVLDIVPRVNKRTVAEVDKLDAKLKDREKAMTDQIRDLKDENDGLKKLLQSNKKATKLLKNILTAPVKKVGTEVEEEDEDTDDDEDKDTNNKVEATQVAQLKEDPDSPPPPPAASPPPPPPSDFDANTVQNPML